MENYRQGAPQAPRIPRNVLVLAFVALASGFGQDLNTPVLPAYLVALGVSSAGIGLADGLLQGATNLFRFVSGVLSDRWRDRKRLVFVGYAFSSLARPFLALTGSFAPVAGLRLLDGVGKGTKDAPRDALVADSSAAAHLGRAFGFHRLVDTAGSVLGPLCATALLLALTPSLQAYRMIFLLSAVPGAVALALIWFGVREPKTVPPTAPGSAGATRGGWHRTDIQRQSSVTAAAPSAQPLPWQFWLFTVGITVAMATKINDSLFLLRAADVGVPRVWVPALFAGFTLIYALLSYPIGVWSDRFGRLPFIAGGWLLLSAVELGFARNPSLFAALLLFAFYGLFYALTEGSARAMIADLAPPTMRGRAYAVFYTLTGVTAIAGGYWLGHLWDAFSPAAAFRLAAVGSLTAAAVFLGMWQVGRRGRKIVVA